MYRQGTIETVLPPRRAPLPLPLAFPGLRFPIIVADPPWTYQNWTAKKNGAVAAHYATMNAADIAALPVAELAAENCALCLWRTGVKTEEAFHVARAWGFEPVTADFLMWVKTTKSQALAKGPGFYSMSGSEAILLAIKGGGFSNGRLHRDVPQVILSPRRHFSAKPPEAMDAIERLWGPPTAERPYLELFARGRRRGWHQWGDEVGPWPEDPDPILAEIVKASDEIKARWARQEGLRSSRTNEERGT